MLTTTDRPADRGDPPGPVHPGEIPREEFLAPLALSAYALASACHVPRTRIERLVREETPVTPDTALRLASDDGAVCPARQLRYTALSRLDGSACGGLAGALQISPSGLPSGSTVRPKKLFRNMAPAP